MGLVKIELDRTNQCFHGIAFKKTFSVYIKWHTLARVSVK